MEIKDSGQRTEFDTGVVRDMHTGKGRMDLLPWEALVEVSKHCEEGALKYGERNCEKGIPIHSLIDSAFRHLAKYMMGMKDEPHLRAAAWNILFALYMEIKYPELQDIPSRLWSRWNFRHLAPNVCISTIGNSRLVMYAATKTRKEPKTISNLLKVRMNPNEDYQRRCGIYHPD